MYVKIELIIANYWFKTQKCSKLHINQLQTIIANKIIVYPVPINQTCQPMGRPDALLSAIYVTGLFCPFFIVGQVASRLCFKSPVV